MPTLLIFIATATTQLVQRFCEPDAPEPRAGVFDTEIVVVDEEELVRRQHGHSLQVAIQLRCIVCREHERLGKNRHGKWRLAGGACLLECWPGSAVQVR